MGQREREKREDWQTCWPGQKNGRYWKRRLAKARRRYIKSVLRTGRGKEPVGYESTVDYKTL